MLRSFVAKYLSFRIGFQMPWLEPAVAMEGISMNSLEKTSSTSNWMDSLWFAAPKSKITRSRKRMRLANKGLKNITHIQMCSTCGKHKLRHRLCMECFKNGKLFNFD